MSILSKIMQPKPHKVTQYLDIFDVEGKRITSLPLLSEKTMDDLKKEAAEKYPDDLAVETSYEDHKLYVSGYTYDKETGQHVPPPEPTAEELADQKAAQQATEAKTTLNSITTRTTRMMLAGGSIAPLQAEYQTTLAAVPDAAALKMTDYFPVWDSASHAYSVGDRVMYDSTLYKCLQAHTSQATWTPTDAPSLWAKVLTSTTGEPLPWEQPDSTNPYMIGDRVTYNGKVYESTIDNNVWAPDAYPQGWKEVTE